MAGVFTRVAVGRARVVREVRAAAPLMAALRAPVPARGPWLTAVLDAGAARPARGAGRSPSSSSRTGRAGRRRVAFLAAAPPRARRRRSRCSGRHRAAAARAAAGPAARRATPRAAELLADGDRSTCSPALRGPWTLRLAGLPLGDPTLAALARPAADGGRRQRPQHAGWSTSSTGCRRRRAAHPRPRACVDRWLPAPAGRRARPARPAVPARRRAAARRDRPAGARGRPRRAAGCGRAAHPGRRRRPLALVGPPRTRGLRTEMGAPLVEPRRAGRRRLARAGRLSPRPQHGERRAPASRPARPPAEEQLAARRPRTRRRPRGRAACTSTGARTPGRCDRRGAVRPGVGREPAREPQQPGFRAGHLQRGRGQVGVLRRADGRSRRPADRRGGSARQAVERRQPHVRGAGPASPATVTLTRGRSRSRRPRAARGPRRRSASRGQRRRGQRHASVGRRAAPAPGCPGPAPSGTAGGGRR